jgi:uncharacterized repeat protein (TIGR01451 family)
MVVRIQMKAVLAALVFLTEAITGFGAEPGRKMLPGHVIPATARLTAEGSLPATNILRLAIGLPLRNQGELDGFLQQLYDPANTNFHKFLTPAEFTARFGPTEADYAAVRNFAETNGFTVTGTHPNRVVLDVTARVADIERAFGVKLHRYRHPSESRDFYAPDVEPSLDLSLPIQHLSGLDNYSLPRPKSVVRSLATVSPANPLGGSGPVINGSATYIGNDFRAAYVPGTALAGSGQSVALLQFDGYYLSDIASYLATANYSTSLTNTLVNVPVNGGVSTPGSGNSEVCLDIEMVLSMAPGVSKIYVYAGPNGGTSWPTILSKIANDNLARQVSCSWGATSPGAPDPTSEGIFKQMAAQGQSFFNASGDSDAFVSGIPFPSESTNITQVGGTTLSTTGPGGAWSSETAWNWGGGTGTSGGVSANYGIPSWQQGISMTANHGSTTMRNVPDVALTGDNVYVAYNNGSFNSFGGTSCAAPLWAGFMALVNQQAAIMASPPVGFVNPAIYAIGKGGSYNACFHDTANGNNYWTSSPTNFPALTGFDLCTGWGTPNGTNLINTLVSPVYFTAITNAGWTLLAESATPANGAIDPGETVTVSFTLQNQGTLASGNLAATLQTNAGVLAPSGPQTYGALAALGGFTNKPFTFTAAGACGSNLVATLQLQDGTNDLGTASFTLPLGEVSTNRVQTFAQNFDGVAVPALPSGWTTVNISGTAAGWETTTAAFDASPDSAFIADPVNPGQNALVSPLIPVAGTNAQLSFRHSYSLEYHGQTYYDGGVLEIQIGNGTFTDILTAGGSFAAGGYNGAITTSSDNPIGGRSAWVGSSSGWKTVTINLPASAVRQNIQLRWNCATDTGNNGGSAVGWNVDSVAIADGIFSCLSVFTDIAVSQSLAANSLQAGQNLVYTLAVTNLGPQSAANVVVTDALPANATFISAPGGNYSSGKVVFSVGTLPAGGLTNCTLTLAPGSGSVFTNVASVATVTPEISTANNGATLVATQAVYNPPVITVPPAAQNIQCGSNASFGVTVTGTPPINLQWTVDGSPIAAATNTSLSLTNVHLPSHTVAVTVTNLYGSATSSVPLTVQDTLAPVITLNSTNPFYLELGATFTDPGATATDTCAGSVPATASGSVNTSAASTNIVTYTANDGNGNTNSATRTVIVQDTTPPTIVWSFTNLVLAANSNCVAAMPNVTGTNFILATDLSGATTITQSPTNNAVLQLGTNTVVIAAADASGNKSYSTNRVIVTDQTPPQMVSQPQSRTNLVGTTASFGVLASACTPQTDQWFFNNLILTDRTNSSLTLSNVSPAAAGNYLVVVTAAGGATTSAVVSLTVNLHPTAVALAASANPSGFKDDLSFTAAVTPTNASGSIQFFTNSAVFDSEMLTAGQAVSTNVSSLPRGTNLITAIYSGDADDLPATNQLLQIVTNHPPTAVPVFFTREAGTPLEIALTNLAASWSDVDGDALSLAAIGISANGVTVTNDPVTLFYAGTNNVADQFVCTISDGFGGTAFQTVNIAVAFPNIISVVLNPAGSITLSLSAAPGYTYVLEATTDLSAFGNWLPVATNTLGTNGVWSFTDTSATNFPQQFYRLRLVQ